MPGGSKESYAELAPILTAISAKSAQGDCVTHIGPRSAGHYVKMVHNGIEYGDMQLIAEAYAVMKHIGGLSNKELAETFSAWNKAELDSFLIEITADIFTRKDPETGNDLVDMILDEGAMKGTGKWTVMDAADISTPATTIANSVEARVISADVAGRKKCAAELAGPTPKVQGDKAQLVADVRAALYASKACFYV
jgi:6-phosphogluconate dehydrogenase